MVLWGQQPRYILQWCHSVGPKSAAATDTAQAPSDVSLTGGLAGGEAVAAAADPPRVGGIARGPAPESSTAEFTAGTPGSPGSSVIEEEDEDEVGIQTDGGETGTDVPSTQSSQSTRGLALAPADAPETADTETETSAAHAANMHVMLVAYLVLLVCSTVMQR